LERPGHAQRPVIRGLLGERLGVSRLELWASGALAAGLTGWFVDGLVRRIVGRFRSTSFFGRGRGARLRLLSATSRREGGRQRECQNGYE
jgi:hypothetical protein